MDASRNEYNPFENRPPGPKTSDFAVLMHLLKSAIGNGILFIPNGFKRTGYIMAIISGIVIGILCTHTIRMLVHGAQELCVRHHIPMLDLARTAELSVEGGPQRFQKYGKAFGVFTNVLICFVHFQACVIYIIYVATSFQQVIEFFTNFHVNVRIYILVMYPILCLLGHTPNLDYLAPFSVIGGLFILGGVFISIYYFVDELPNPTRLPALTGILPIPMYCNLLLYALHNATLCLPLENSMQNPQRLPLLIIVNVLMNTTIYMIFGLLGYNKYAERTCDTVIKNLPLDQPLAQTVKITITISVLLTYGLAFIVPIDIIWPMIEGGFPGGSWAIHLFRFTAVSVTVLVAVAVPIMVPLLGLLASFSMTSIMLMIPTVIDTTTKWNRASKFILTKNTLIIVIYLILTIFGSIEGGRSIVSEYSGGGDTEC